MTTLTYSPHRTLTLKTHPELNEKWVQEGLMRDDSPRGVWEITDKGRQLVESET